MREGKRHTARSQCVVYKTKHNYIYGARTTILKYPLTNDQIKLKNTIFASPEATWCEDTLVRRQYLAFAVSGLRRTIVLHPWNALFWLWQLTDDWPQYRNDFRLSTQLRPLRRLRRLTPHRPNGRAGDPAGTAHEGTFSHTTESKTSSHVFRIALRGRHPALCLPKHEFKRLFFFATPSC